MRDMKHFIISLPILAVHEFARKSIILPFGLNENLGSESLAFAGLSDPKNRVHAIRDPKYSPNVAEFPHRKNRKEKLGKKNLETDSLPPNRKALL